MGRRKAAVAHPPSGTDAPCSFWRRQLSHPHPTEDTAQSPGPLHHLPKEVYFQPGPDSAPRRCDPAPKCLATPPPSTAQAQS